MLKGLLKAKMDAQAALVNAAVTAGRAMTDEETSQFNALETDIKGLEATIQAAHDLEVRNAALNTPVNQPIWAQPKSQDKPWKSLGEQLAAVRNAALPGGSVDPRLTIKAASGLNESIGSDGGFLVEQDFVAELLKRAYETAILASKIKKIPLSTNANSLKINAIDETSRVNGSRWGGIQAFWEGEAEQYTAKKPKFRPMNLNLKKLTGLCYATDELLEDAAALEAVISEGFAEEFGFKIDDAIINGTGAGMPQGIMNSNALVAVAKENGQAAATITVENIVKMWARCWGRSRQNAEWYINQDIEPQLYTMSLAVGTGGVPVYMPTNGLSGSPYGTLFGRPVIPLEQCQTLGTVGDIILGDLSQYVAIDKNGINAASSIHVRFDYGETAFRFTYRIDGQPIWNAPLQPFKGSNTLSPFVALAARV